VDLTNGSSHRSEMNHLSAAPAVGVGVCRCVRAFVRSCVFVCVNHHGLDGAYVGCEGERKKKLIIK
jgi:hypothetical protein